MNLLGPNGNGSNALVKTFNDCVGSYDGRCGFEDGIWGRCGICIRDWKRWASSVSFRSSFVLLSHRDEIGRWHSSRAASHGVTLFNWMDVSVVHSS